MLSFREISSSSHLAGGPPIAESAKAVVKWYRTDKRFGFVTLAATGEDAFVHASALEEAGVENLDQSATIVCDVARGSRGLQVVNVRQVVPGRPPMEGAEREPIARERPGAPKVMRGGAVKFFDACRGFGFIAVPDGGPDVFLHARILGRLGLPVPREGQPVRFLTGPGRKGDEVVEIEYL